MDTIPASLRFWRLVRIPDDPDACWIWLGEWTSNEYGRFELIPKGVSRPRKRVRAHRFAYEITYGPVPDDVEIHHICHEKSCVNPSHLQALTKIAHYVETFPPS